MSGPVAEDIRDQVFDPLKSWLLGFLAGDGHVQRNTITYTYKVFGSVGQDRLLAERVAAAIETVYGVPAAVMTQDMAKWGRKPNVFVHCGRKAVVDDLLTLALFGRRRWTVPELVKSGTDEIKAAWIRGFADADGCMLYDLKRSKRYVSLDSVNQAGLDEVSELLTSLGIRHVKATPHDRKIEGHAPGCKLIVCYHEDLKRYAKLVGFTCEDKKKKLEEAIASYERTPKRTEEIEANLPEVRRRREAGESWNEIAAVLGLSRENVRALCQRHAIECQTSCRGRVERLVPTMIKLREEGLTATEIAEELGLKNKNVVNNAFARARRVAAAEPTQPAG